MTPPVQISFHGIDHSDAVADDIEARAGKLSGLFDQISRCRVVVSAHHRNSSHMHHTGEPFQVTIHVHVPGEDLVVNHSPKNVHRNEDIRTAVADAFSAIERRLKDYAQRLRGEVKHRAVS